VISKSRATAYLASEEETIRRNSTIASSVDLPGINPNCQPEMFSGPIDVLSRQSLLSFSKSFPITERRQMGQYDFGSFLYLSPPFRKTGNKPLIQIERKIPHQKHPLKILIIDWE